MRFSMNWRRPLSGVLSLGLLLVGGTAFAADGAPKTAPAAAVRVAQQRPGHAAIASANFLATNAGHEVLAKGGNAFDAAIAVAATLSVVEPESSGIGGGFWPCCIGRTTAATSSSTRARPRPRRSTRRITSTRTAARTAMPR